MGGTCAQRGCGSCTAGAGHGARRDAAIGCSTTRYVGGGAACLALRHAPTLEYLDVAVWPAFVARCTGALPGAPTVSAARPRLLDSSLPTAPDGSPRTLPVEVERGSPSKLEGSAFGQESQEFGAGPSSAYLAPPPMTLGDLPHRSQKCTEIGPILESA